MLQVQNLKGNENSICPLTFVSQCVTVMLVCLVSAASLSSLHKNAPFLDLQVEFYLLGVKYLIV